MWHTQPHYTLSDLGHIHAPTLVMAGQYDKIKREHTDQLAKAIPGSQEFIIAGAAHSTPTEKPEIVNSKILAFLDQPIQ
jgi:pimeloyl-ACP methyl ester carboxylesterase